MLHVVCKLDLILKYWYFVGYNFLAIGPKPLSDLSADHRPLLITPQSPEIITHPYKLTSHRIIDYFADCLEYLLVALAKSTTQVSTVRSNQYKTNLQIE